MTGQGLNQPTRLLGPIAPEERIDSIDVLRGVAVLGILTVNIWSFGMPFDIALTPSRLHPLETPDLIAFHLSWLFVEGSQRAIFSMLFGAGIVLLTTRLSKDERSALSRRIYYRRTWWLIVFGLFDAYLLYWYGDILFTYGVVGLILYFARDWSPAKLLAVAGLILALITAFNAAMNMAMDWSTPLAKQAELKQRHGEQLSEDEILAQAFIQSQPGRMTEEELKREIETRAGGYISAFRSNAVHSFEFHVVYGLFSVLWDAMAMMLIGMALFKLKVLDASRSMRFYWVMASVGLSIGLAVNAWEIRNMPGTDFSRMFMIETYDIGRLCMAIGLIGVIMLVCKLQMFSRARGILSAVGRMALTNYLTQSILCNLFFVGLGMFGALKFHQLYYVVFFVLALQLAWSPWWLKRHRYGPFEWVWRKLAYSGLNRAAC